ncbi:hypothetical protein [Aquimarina intermedia]|uniref:Cardiolipin synthetase n=1 Tax=Aquimarina intermedia TaxID=350814 RepID=A0A5S5C4K7_9FLAO|nr:hypothetical protein [Aquimarina intermedia]TYP74247.1 hypothetical protein BD809_10465 [Aquimarina intermedia]
MINFKHILILLFGILFSGCNSSELIENWKHPDIDIFEAQKVLVVGMTRDEKSRKNFEKKLVNQLENNGIKALASYKVFETNYTEDPKTEKELLTLESNLIEQGFDAILISKVVGVEEKVTLAQAYKNMDRMFDSFKDDYFNNQNIYHNEKYYDEYKIYHAESTLYCVCPDRERETIWKGSIDITEPQRIEKAVNDYIKVLIWALKEQNVLMRAETDETDDLFFIDE